MRADLQALVNKPNLANGHNNNDKQMVLAWLLMRQYVPNVALNMPTVANKVSGLQGVNPNTMLDLLIQGLTAAQGLPNDFPTVKNMAKTAINGTGVVSGGVNVNMGETDWITLQNYAMLTICKVLNDAS